MALKINWIAVKSAYLTGIPVSDIAKKFQIAEGTLYARIKRQDWKKSVTLESVGLKQEMQGKCKEDSTNSTEVVLFSSKNVKNLENVEKMQGIDGSAKLLELVTENIVKKQQGHIAKMEKIMEKHLKEVETRPIAILEDDHKTQLECIDKVDRLTRRTLGMPIEPEVTGGANTINIAALNVMNLSDLDKPLET